jgi:hypothetical protein
MLPSELEQKAIIQKALDILAEHFEVAQVFVQVHRGDDDTVGFEAGFGNFFARQMQISRWCEEEVYGHQSHSHSSQEEEDDE